MTKALYKDDAYLKSCTAIVVSTDQNAIVVNQTIFYPLGGGQPGDTGVTHWKDQTLKIVDTRRGDGGNILHITEPDASLPEAGTQVIVTLDWDRRYAHMRMHTGLHLLGVVMPYAVTGGAIHANKSRLDFDLQDTVDKDKITEKLNELVEADHPVLTRWITDDELDSQPELIRTMSVKPPRGVGKIRLLEIPNVDLQPCGGTHVSRTGEIGRLRVSKVEKKGRHNRRVHVVFD